MTNKDIYRKLKESAQNKFNKKTLNESTYVDSLVNSVLVYSKYPINEESDDAFERALSSLSPEQQAEARKKREELKKEAKSSLTQPLQVDLSKDEDQSYEARAARGEIPSVSAGGDPLTGAWSQVVAAQQDVAASRAGHDRIAGSFWGASGYPVSPSKAQENLSRALRGFNVEAEKQRQQTPSPKSFEDYLQQDLSQKERDILSNYSPEEFEEFKKQYKKSADSPTEAQKEFEYKLRQDISTRSNVQTARELATGIANVGGAAAMGAALREPPPTVTTSPSARPAAPTRGVRTTTPPTRTPSVPPRRLSEDVSLKQVIGELLSEQIARQVVRPPVKPVAPSFVRPPVKPPVAPPVKPVAPPVKPPVAPPVEPPVTPSTPPATPRPRPPQPKPRTPLPPRTPSPKPETPETPPSTPPTVPPKPEPKPEPTIEPEVTPEIPEVPETPEIPPEVEPTTPPKAPDLPATPGIDVPPTPPHVEPLPPEVKPSTPRIPKPIWPWQPKPDISTPDDKPEVTPPSVEPIPPEIVPEPKPSKPPEVTPTEVPTETPTEVPTEVPQPQPQPQPKPETWVDKVVKRPPWAVPGYPDPGAEWSPKPRPRPEPKPQPQPKPEPQPKPQPKPAPPKVIPLPIPLPIPPKEDEEKKQKGKATVADTDLRNLATYFGKVGADNYGKSVRSGMAIDRDSGADKYFKRSFIGLAPFDITQTELYKYGAQISEEKDLKSITSDKVLHRIKLKKRK